MADIAMWIGTVIEFAAYLMIALRIKTGWVALAIVGAIYGSVQYSYWGLGDFTVYVYPVNIVLCIWAFRRWNVNKIPMLTNESRDEMFRKIVRETKP